MEELATWEKIALGLIMGAVALLAFPGLRRSLKDAPKGTGNDWRGVLVPLVLVILFVFLLVKLS